jgi:hypothetical protein
MPLKKETYIQPAKKNKYPIKNTDYPIFHFTNTRNNNFTLKSELK